MKKLKSIGTITILVKDRHNNSKAMNDLLTEAGYLVLARLGVNPNPKCLQGCEGMIAVAVEGTTKEINDLARKLNKLKGLVAKVVIVR